MIERNLTRPMGDNPPRARLLYGQDVRESLKLLNPHSVQMVATSPPYWGLRDYGGEAGVWGGDSECDHEWGDPGKAHHPGQIEQSKWKSAEAAGKGQTSGSGQFCLHCNAWLGHLGLEPTPHLFAQHVVEVFESIRRVLRRDGVVFLNLGDTYFGSTWAVPQESIKPKDLVGIPWRVALALQDAGWYLRNDIIWSKSNCMPESVRDRCTRSHEYIFLLAHPESGGVYFFDSDAIREPHKSSGKIIPWQDKKYDQEMLPSGHHQNAGSYGQVKGRPQGIAGFSKQGRNKRTVWAVNQKGYPGSHFAVWPEELVDPMVKAGSSQHGCCSRCRAPYKRALNEEATEWEPTCNCPDPEVVPCLVLDAFSGSATTGVVAWKNGRDYVGTDIQPDYLNLAVARLEGRKPPEKESQKNTPDLIAELFG